MGHERRDVELVRRDRLDVEIAAMRRRDLPAVLRIEQLVQPTPWSMNLFLQELSAKGRTYVVARRAGPGDVIGYAGGIHVAGDGHVATIGVDPAWRRRGVGARLLVALTRGMIGHGASAMTLEVRVSNTAAQDLYRRFGYAPVGMRKNYYSDVGEDAVIMWAHEVDGADYAALLDRHDAGTAAPPGSDDAHEEGR